MNSAAGNGPLRGAAVLFVLLLLISIQPVHSDAARILEARSPAEEIASSRPARPAAPYRKVDYLFPASSVRNPRVYIFKGRRRLQVLEDDTLIRDYPIGLGPCPIGDKEKRGDGRTPEGEFFVCAKNPRSRYYKSVGLSYPGKKHAVQAFLSGLLSFGDYEKILEAQTRGLRPPWGTSLGGGICIHGGGAHEDWTKGCVALYNFDMNELFSFVTLGTPVYILP